MNEETENAIKATALREAAADFRSRVAHSWGDDTPWFTTGTRVANRAAEFLDELAEEYEVSS